MRYLTFIQLGVVIVFSMSCHSVRLIRDEVTVKKDVAAIVRDEAHRDRFEGRLQQYGFNIQRSPDRSECEAQLCLDNHCRRVFVLTYRVEPSGRVIDVATEVWTFRDMKSNQRPNQAPPEPTSGSVTPRAAAFAEATVARKPRATPVPPVAPL